MKSTDLIGGCELVEALPHDDLACSKNGSALLIQIISQNNPFKPGAFVFPAHALLTFSAKGQIIVRLWDDLGNGQKIELPLANSDPETFFQVRIASNVWVSITGDPASTATLCIFSKRSALVIQNDPSEFFKDHASLQKDQNHFVPESG